MSSANVFSENWFPIQVKQTDKADRPHIDAFEAIIERESEGARERGFFVLFGDLRD